MSRRPFALVPLLAALAMLVAACGGVAAAAAPPDQLRSEVCLTCHDGSGAKIEVPAPDDETRALHPVDPQALAKSVHGSLPCTACHVEITDAVAKHQKVPGAKPPDCMTCHQKLQADADAGKAVPAMPRMKTIAENIGLYKDSVHAKPNADDPTRPNAKCNDCHNVHSFNVPLRDSPARTEWHLGIPALCGKCHEEQLETWTASVHGREVAEKHNPKSAVCSDCHTTHDIKGPRTAAAKLVITANCGNCHEERYASYKDTYHGKITTLGYGNTAKCFNCHGGHDIEPTSNPASLMHAEHRMETCQECHNGKKGVFHATSASFLSFAPHGTIHDADKYPQMWLANRIMTWLLLGTFTFFWLHTGLWFFREYRERKKRAGQQHVRIEGLPAAPAAAEGKRFQRFTRTWRIAHFVFLLAVMTLTLTGIPLFFPEAPWATPLMGLLGGPTVARVIHRTAALTFVGVFVWHLFYVGIGILRDRKRFKLFGPNSLIPNVQDFKDIYGMFRWFIGKGPRPVFDRWTYWEKFDYWAPFWGVAVVGLSGIVMWIPHTAAEYLPGWIFNVAPIFHGDEAFLAIVFLFTVHFFNNHFRPDKFPLDRLMFTGSMTLEELKAEHALEYTRLVESGELEKYLVNPPSVGFWKFSTVLGFTLITIGLTLLTLVGIGFFTNG